MVDCAVVIRDCVLLPSFVTTAVRHPGHVFVADDNQIGPLVCLLPTATQDQYHPSVVRPKEGPLPDQLQDTSKDESLCCFRDCDFISGDCLLSSVDCILSSGGDEQCSSVPLRGRLRKSTANTVVDKSFATPPKITRFRDVCI